MALSDDMRDTNARRATDRKAENAAKIVDEARRQHLIKQFGENEMKKLQDPKGRRPRRGRLYEE